MKKMILLILAGLLAASCRPMQATPMALASQTEESAPLPTITAQPTFTKIPPLAATSTLELPSPVPPAAAPTETPYPPPQTVPSNVIQFDAGGTWKDVTDSVAQGKSKTYSLNAMQGQVMSVSITGGYFPLRIVGADGTTLCPASANSECSFWRSALPRSQDYFITVQSSGGATDFVLRVAINPLNKAQQFFTYQAPSGLTLTYTDAFAPADVPAALNNKTELSLALRLMDASFYEGTNLGEAYAVFGADAQNASTCEEPNQTGGAPEMPNGRQTFNGYSFAYSVASGAGAGNLYDQHIYRSAQNSVCYEIIFFIHSSNIGNYAPGAVKEFDAQGLMQKFNIILASLQIR
ncbi:MAG: hypothetical protein Fur002_12790 [Anaerolineales bacterium]